LPDVIATADAYTKVGDGQKSHLDILELHGGYALLLIAFPSVSTFFSTEAYNRTVP